MSAVVTRIKTGSTSFVEDVVVPNITHHRVDRDGWLYLLTSQYGDVLAVFKSWEYFVIDPPVLRGPGGRFIKKEN